MSRGTTAFLRSPGLIPHNIPHGPFMAGFETQNDLPAKFSTRRKLVFQQNRPIPGIGSAEMHIAERTFEAGGKLTLMSWETRRTRRDACHWICSSCPNGNSV